MNNDAKSSVIIPLTQGRFAIVDAVDTSSVIQHKWRAVNVYGRWYAYTDIVVMGRRRSITMHGFLIKPPIGREVDHINHDGLDNRRVNLRLCTRSQNMANSRRCGGKSKYRNVYWYASRKKWFAKACIDGRQLSCGGYWPPNQEKSAARCADALLVQLWGEFALTNAMMYPGDFLEKNSVK